MCRGLQAELIAACKRRAIPVLCVGGAAAKADPTRMRFMDLAEATGDPLIRSVRHRLRTAHGVKAGVQVLMSTEKPRCGLVTTAEQAAAPSMLDYQVLRFACRTYLHYVKHTLLVLSSHVPMGPNSCWTWSFSPAALNDTKTSCDVFTQSKEG